MNGQTDTYGLAATSQLAEETVMASRRLRYSIVGSRKEQPGAKSVLDGNASLARGVNPEGDEMMDDIDFDTFDGMSNMDKEQRLMMRGSSGYMGKAIGRIVALINDKEALAEQTKEYELDDDFLDDTELEATRERMRKEKEENKRKRRETRSDRS